MTDFTLPERIRLVRTASESLVLPSSGFLVNCKHLREDGVREVYVAELPVWGMRSSGIFLVARNPVYSVSGNSKEVRGWEVADIVSAVSALDALLILRLIPTQEEIV